MRLVHNVPIRLLGLSGSLRSASTNTAILRAVQDALRDSLLLDIYSLKDLPLFNGDQDKNPPFQVERFKAAIAESDGIIICSPEYNHGIPGVLKNALDWASRPSFSSPLKDKAVLVMTSSPAPPGGVRAQYQIRETLASTLSRVVTRREIVIGAAPQKVHEGRFSDPTSLQFILDAVQDLLAEIDHLRHTGTVGDATAQRQAVASR